MASVKMADSENAGNLAGNGIRALEFYSGIGGMHCAMERALGRRACVLGAFDINTTVNSVYKHNFPSTPHFNRNLCGLTAKELDGFEADLFTMSPPCQPFTRQGKREDCRDHRTDSFFHLLSLLPQLKNRVKYIVVENVQGFEGSETRNHLIKTLQTCGMEHREFLLSPAQFGIPNSRLRYYLVAKLKSEPQFAFPPAKDGKPDQSLPVLLESAAKSEQSLENIILPQETISSKVTKDVAVTEPKSASSAFDLTRKSPPNDHYRKICNFCPNFDLAEAEFATYAVPSKIASRYITAMDIVTAEDSRSCCFTKGYGHYVVGTGSILQQNQTVDLHPVYLEYCAEVSRGQSRVKIMFDSKFGSLGIEWGLKGIESGTQSGSVTSQTLSESEFNSDIGQSNNGTRMCHSLENSSDSETTPIVPQSGKIDSPILKRNPESDSLLVPISSMPTDCRQDVAEMNPTIAQSKENVCHVATEDVKRILSPLRLRYFTEYEIASFLCFPSTFSFPESVSLKQRYRALGNSLNVHVVTLLMQCLFEAGPS